MTYATENQVRLAQELGYTVTRDQRRGHSFKRAQRHIWAASRRTEDGRVPAWQTADLVDGRYTNHQMFDDLSDALRRPL